MPAPRRRSWPRRFLRGLVGLSLLGLLLLALALTFLHTPAGGTTARAILQQWGSRAIGGKLRLGNLDLHLLNGRAAVTAVSLSLDGVTVDAQRVEIDWSAKAGTHVRLLRPRIVVRDTGEPAAPPATGLAAQPWRALENLAKAEIEDGRLELRDAKGEPWLVLGRFDAEMAEEGGRRRVWVRIADAGVGWPDGGLHVKPASADATLALEDGQLAFERARIVAGESSIDLRGRLDRISPITATATARAAFDGALVEALAPDTGLVGRVAADATVEVKDDAVTGTLVTTAPALTLKGLGPWAASGRGRFEGPRLVLESLEAKGYGGRLVAEGPLALLSSEKTDVRVRAEGIDVAALAAAFTSADVPVAARADGSLRWATTGWDVDAARGTGEIALGPSPRAPEPSAAPGLPLSGSGSVRIAGRSVALEGVRVEAHGAWLTADAALAPEGTVRGSWNATLPLASVNALVADLGSKARLDEEYTGTLLAEGHVAGAASSLEHGGTLRSEGLAVHGRLHSVEAQARYAAGRLELAPLVVRSGLGQATLAGSVPVLADAGEWDLRGEIESLDLAPLLALAGIEGDGPASGTLRIGGPRDAPRARTDLDARFVLAEEGRTSGEPVAVTLAASSDGGRVEVERLTAEIAGGRIEGSGRYDAGTRAIEAKARASGLAWARLPLLPPSLRRLGSTLGADVSLGGTTEAPSGEAHATLGEATLDGAPLPVLAFDARADGKKIEIGGRAGEAAFLKGTGQLESDWPARLEIDVARLPAQALLDAVTAGRLPDATLEAQGTVVLDVPLRDAGRFRYTGEGLAARGRVRRLEWSTDRFKVEGTVEEATVEGLRLTTRAIGPSSFLARAQATEEGGRGAQRVPAGGLLTVDGRFPFAEGRTFDLAVKGDFALAAVEAVAPESQAVGQASLEAHLGGTIAAPDLSGTFGVVGGRARVEDVRVSAVQVTGHFQGREALVDQASARVLGGSVLVSGSVPLAPLEAGRSARLHVEATDVDLSRFAVPGAQRTADSPSFLVSVSGDFEATAPGLASLRGEGQFTRVESRTEEGTFGLAAPATWRLADGRLVQETLRLAGPLGTLEASADVVLTGTPGGSATFAGPFDLRLVSPFVPDTTLAGPARADLRAKWDASGARVEGLFSVDGGRVTLETLAFTASQLNGEVRFLGDRAEIDATAAAGDGHLVAYGGMNFGPGLFGPAAMSIEAERVPVNYPEGFRGRATGAILVDGDAGSYRISGLVDLTQAYYTAEFDARLESLDRLDYQLAALSGRGSILDDLPLAIDVRFKDPLRIRNRQAELDVTGTMTANGTLAQPTATGQVALIEGGRITFRRARIRAQEGRVELNGYPAGVPDVDFEGLTQVGGVTMNLRAQGSMNDLALDIRSPNRPELSQTDLVALLLTGRTTTAAASEGGAILAEELAASLGGALQGRAGDTLLIEVSSDESMLLDEGDPTQRFKIGTKVGKDLAVFYSTRLDGAEQRWVGQWNPNSGRFTFRAIQDSEEGQVVELSDRVSFNVFPGRERSGTKPSVQLSRLDSLRFEGALPLPEEELRRATKLKIGRRYDPLRLAKAADQVRAKLVEAGFRAASVDEMEHEAADRKGRVELVLRVEAGPRIVVSWVGDDPGEKVRQRALDAWPPYASPEAAAAALARAARFELQAAGHYEAKVGQEVRVTDAETGIVLSVVQGPKGQGVDVEFEGNERLTGEELLRTFPKPGSREFFAALDRGAHLVAQARVAYAGLGYMRARVGPARSRFEAASGRLLVTVPVREGASSLVAALTLPDGVPPPGEDGPELKLREGEPFDVEAYLADRDAIAAWYRREGWMEARVRGALEVSNGDVRVTLAADPGPRPRLGEVRVVSSGRTYEKMIRRAVQVRPGEIIRPQQLAETRTRLAELGTFSSVDLRTVPARGRAGIADLEVSYVERPDVELEYGVRYDASGTSNSASGDVPTGPSEGQLQAAAALRLASPFGRGWRFGAYTLQTSVRHNYRLGLESSTLFGLRVRTQILAFDETDDEAAIAASYSSKVRGFAVQQSRALRWDTGSRRWHERLRLQWGYTNEDIRYQEEIGSYDIIAGNRAFLSVALIGDRRDSLTDPHRGVFWTATTELSRRFLGSDVDYVRLYGQIFTYLPLPGGLVWAQGYRAGVVPGDDPFYLLDNRFQAGGPTTVRGFRQNGLGPQLDEEEGLGGQGVFVFNQEIRFPIWKSLKGGVFWDAGNSWLWGYEFSLRDLRHTVGGGLRIMFPFGPVRLEYGFILDRRQNSDGSYVEPRGRFVFGLGHAF